MRCSEHSGRVADLEVVSWLRLQVVAVLTWLVKWSVKSSAFRCSVFVEI